MRGANGTLPCHRGRRDARAGRRFGETVASGPSGGQIGVTGAGAARQGSARDRRQGSKGMNDRPKSGDKTAAGLPVSAPAAGPADGRAARLAAQLKANLQRRKAQARGRAAGADEPE